MPIRKKMLTTTWFRSTESRVRPTSFSKKYLQVFKVCRTSSCPSRTCRRQHSMHACAHCELSTFTKATVGWRVPVALMLQTNRRQKVIELKSRRRRTGHASGLDLEQVQLRKK